VKALVLRKAPIVIKVGDPIFTMCLFRLPSAPVRSHPKNFRTRAERERHFIDQEQGFHLRRIADLIGEDSIDRLADDAFERKTALAVNQRMKRLWKPIAIAAFGYLCLVLAATAYGADVAAMAKAILDWMWSIYKR
jgi:hypothetical protein